MKNFVFLLLFLCVACGPSQKQIDNCKFLVDNGNSAKAIGFVTVPATSWLGSAQKRVLVRFKTGEEKAVKQHEFNVTVGNDYIITVSPTNDELVIWGRE